MSNPTPYRPPSHAEVLDLLHEAAQLIGAFRRRLREAGFPFQEPPATGKILAGIDAACYPVAEPGRPRKGAGESPAP